MAPEEAKRRAEALLRLPQMQEGRLLLDELQHEYDESMRQLLFAKSDEIFAAQGRAQAYNSIFKKFGDAKKVLGG